MKPVANKVPTKVAESQEQPPTKEVVLFNNQLTLLEDRLEELKVEHAKANQIIAAQEILLRDQVETRIRITGAVLAVEDLIKTFLATPNLGSANEK